MGKGDCHENFGEIRKDNFYSLDILGRRLGVSRDVLRKWEREGLPVIRKGQKTGLIWGGDLVEFLLKDRG